jgi:nucleoid-associated protein YgaU
LAVLRLAAFAAAAYGIVLSSATLAAIVTRRPDIERLATSMAPPRLRRVLVGLIGLGIVSSVAGAPVAPSTVTTATATAIRTTTSTSAPSTSAPSPMSAAPTSRDRNPTAPVTHADTPVAEPALPDLWVMKPGDHLWRVASVSLAQRLGRDARTDEIDHYWRAIIDLNRESLVDPDNPDLVMVGQVIELPPS